VISTLVALDREARNNYVFTVQATDNGQVPLSGYTAVREVFDISSTIDAIMQREKDFTAC